MKKNRAIALTLCALLCLAMVFSVLYTATEAGHDCAGENCRICLGIGSCISLLSGLSLALLAACPHIRCGGTIISVFSGALFHREDGTLVALKVKQTI